MPQRTTVRGVFLLALAAAFVAGSPLATPARAARDWAPVPTIHLAIVQPKVERDADAEALLWEVKVDDEISRGGLLSVREHFQRVKVFTQKGAQDWSKHDLDYPGKGVSVSDISARTIRPDGSIVEMDRKSIGRETLIKTRGSSINRVSFALPGVEPGCIVEYRYRESIRGDEAFASSYPFQLRIPVHKVVYRIRPLAFPGLIMRQFTFHVAAVTSPMSTDGYHETSAINQPAFVTEPDMPPEAQQLAFMVLFYTLEAQGTPEAYWPGVGKATAEWFEKDARPDERMREAARALVDGAASDRERVERIARWMRTGFKVVRSVASDSLKAAGLRQPSDAREAWRQKGGRYYDALLVFGALARGAGLDVRWIKVPSRSQLFFNRNMLSDGFLGSYQVAIRLDGRWATYDPVARYLPWDMRPWDEEATMGLLCDRDSSDFVETSYSQPEHTVRRRSADLALQPDGTLEGTLRLTWSGHLNDEFRQLFADVGAEELDSLATSTHSDDAGTIRLSNASLERGTDEAAPLGLSAKVVLPEFASVTGKRILLEPAVFHAHAKPRYPASGRRHPVYYRFPWAEVDTVRIRLPAGWKVETADSVEAMPPQEVSDYTAAVTVSADGAEVLYVRRFRMGIDGNIYFAPKYYPGVKQMFDDIHRRDRVSLALVRSGTEP